MQLSPSLSVIIVEDQPAILHHLEYLLQLDPAFHIIGSCRTVKEALALIKISNPDLLLLDIGLPDGTGFDVLEQMPPADTKVIFLTAHQEHITRAMEYNAVDYLLKPLDEEEFKKALKKVTST